MSSTLKSQQVEQEKIVEDAINLLSQQIWCWGKDIEKSEGNWLLEIGFSLILVFMKASCGKQTSAHANHLVDKEISESSLILPEELSLKKTITSSLYPKVIKGG